MSVSQAALLPRPLLFWTGVALTCAGVAEHLWMFVDSASMDFHMAMMGTSPVMWVAMAAIVAGVVLSGVAIVPPRTGAPAPAAASPAVATAAPAHSSSVSRRRLIGVLTFALLVDQMKPATLAFISPGLRAEYHLSVAEVSWLPTVALTGTVLGSLVWGRAADRVGRRATILLSSLLFLGTTVCGAMPTFGGTLVMCALMGMAAGGMLPVVYALMTESLPPGRRAAIMVLQAGLTTTGGYMAASGIAAVLIPLAGWRVTWFAQLPLVLVLIAMNRWIPESAAFTTRPARTARVPASALFRRPRTVRTLVVSAYALAWGLVYWGFITLLPGQIEATDRHGMSAATLLFVSSLLAIPTCAAGAWLYMRWSARGTMVGYAALTVAALVTLAGVGLDGSRPVLLATVMLLFAGTAGVIALIGPYTAEIYPTAVRGTAGGWAAAVGKSGGAFGPPLIALILPAPGGIRTAAVCVALPMALAGLAVATRGSDPAARTRTHDDTTALDTELGELGELDDLGELGGFRGLVGNEAVVPRTAATAPLPDDGSKAT